jgi:beta-mannosidase
MHTQLLSGTWDLRHEPIHHDVDYARHLTGTSSSDADWIKTHVPSDVHEALIENGTIKDPVVGLESFACEWIEERSFWYRKTFCPSDEVRASTRIELVCESLDAEADVFLNDVHLGHQKSSFYPFRREVRSILREGENELLIRLTSGLERYSAAEVSPYSRTVSKTYRRGDERRVFVRKPQYGYGWDWGPRIATCGIVGDVSLFGYTGVAVRGCSVSTVSATAEDAELSMDIEVELLHNYRSADVEISIDISLDDTRVESKTTKTHLQSGTNFITILLSIANPALWWPNGWGEQPLYKVRIRAEIDEGTDEWPIFEYGIRTLELCTDPIPDGDPSDRKFGFVVNGKPIFCKGGNWIPADSVYARVTDAKYERLVDEAAKANFTMLRIWGGGLYERDVFYRTCNRKGILVWQDFMFACAKYPDELAWFIEESEREIEYQTKRLRNHSCLALFCGNNENHWGFHDWWTDGDNTHPQVTEQTGGARIYNHVAPGIVRNNAAHIPYWRSSPYGGDDPNGNIVGDRHHWHDCTMNPDMEKRITPEEYNKVASKFVSEYGYIGPCCRTTIEKYHGGTEIDRTSELWDWHNNTFEKETVAAGIGKHYLEPTELSLNDYLLYAGLVQSLMYQYSLESIRCAPNCGGSLFWMYNDCWGEVGWTIIDYYLFRKPSYYAVKRAFAPRKLILRQSGNLVTVYGVNDTSSTIEFALEYGYVNFDGTGALTAQTTIELKAATTGKVLSFEAPDMSANTGICFVRPAATANSPRSSALPEPATLRSDVFRAHKLEKPFLMVSDVTQTDAGYRFTVATDVFAHAVHFGLGDDARYSDAYFDLLPGESRTVEVCNVSGEINAERIAAQSVVPFTK